MKRSATIVALALVASALVALAASPASAYDHFARQRQESLARVAAAQHHLNHGPSYGAQGHWGGPTTNHRYYNPSRGYGIQQNTQFYSGNRYGNPYGYGAGYNAGYGAGYGVGYGVPAYGNYGRGYSNYGGPNCGVGGSGVYIHREIYHGR